MKMRRMAPILLRVAVLAAISQFAKAQAPTAGGASTPTTASPSSNTTHVQPGETYTPPTTREKFLNYLFDSFGPYPIIGAAFVAGLDQASKRPPEWGQGAEGYGRRFGSNFGIALTTTTTHYVLAAAFREDTLYYRCECKGVLQRLGHAVISTITARRGQDGHHVFSFPGLVAPYAGTMTAALGWYPSRYSPKDGFRMGNYNLLAFTGGNIALEFLYGGPHTLLSRVHLGGSRVGKPSKKH
jgi:hypothetical protein